MAHATEKLTVVNPKKHSVRFDAEDTEGKLFSSIYMNRDAAKELLGVKKLEDVKGIEVTVRVIK